MTAKHKNIHVFCIRLSSTTTFFCTQEPEPDALIYNRQNDVLSGVIVKRQVVRRRLLFRRARVNTLPDDGVEALDFLMVALPAAEAAIM